MHATSSNSQSQLHNFKGGEFMSGLISVKEPEKGIFYVVD